MNPEKVLMSLILNMRFQPTGGNWQCVSRARSVLSASLSNKMRSPPEIQPAVFDNARLLGCWKNIARGASAMWVWMCVWVHVQLDSPVSVINVTSVHTVCLCVLKAGIHQHLGLPSHPASSGGGVGVGLYCTTFVLVFMMVYDGTQLHPGL